LIIVRAGIYIELYYNNVINESSNTCQMLCQNVSQMEFGMEWTYIVAAIQGISIDDYDLN